MALDPLLAVAHKRLNDEQRQQQDNKKRRLLCEMRAAPPTFLTAGDPGFEELVHNSYVGLARYPAEQLAADFATSSMRDEAVAAAEAAANLSSTAAASSSAASAAAPFDLHSALQRDCFGRLLHEGLFFRDVIQVGSNDAGGTASAATSARQPRFHYVRTRVQRCLVGDAGLTYRYSGVRLFAHPWNAEEVKGESTATTQTKTAGESVLPPSIAPSLRLLSVLNSHLRSVAEQRLKALAQEMSTADVAASETTPSAAATSSSSTPSAAAPAAALPAPTAAGAAFNLVLLNYLDPSTHALPLRPEPYYSMGPMAVGWHRDESLHPLSTIAVYHSSEEDQARPDQAVSGSGEEAKEQPGATSSSSARVGGLWSIALKRAWDIKTPAILVPLRSGDSYCMLHALNTTHQHAVIAGDHRRFSSTHRSAITEGQTIESITRRCADALAHDWSAGRIPQTVSVAHAYLLRLSELLSAASDAEFEWIRQFWLQGARHAQMHAYYWRPRIERLEAQWAEMQRSIACVYQTLGQYGFSQTLVNDAAEVSAASAAGAVASADAAASTPLVALDLPLCRMLLQSLTQTSALRAQWANRVRQDAYHPKPQQCDPPSSSVHRGSAGAASASSASVSGPFEDAPIVRPEFKHDVPLPYDLSSNIAELQQWMPEFEQRRQWSQGASGMQ